MLSAHPEAGVRPEGNFFIARKLQHNSELGRFLMNGIIYLVGLVVIVMAILSFIGLR
jgi:hypothetical protein